MEFPKPTPRPRPVAVPNTKVEKPAPKHRQNDSKANKPFDKNRGKKREYKPKPTPKKFWWVARSKSGTTRIIEAATENEVLKTFFGELELVPESIEKAKLVPFVVETVGGDTVDILAVDEAHAQKIFYTKFNTTIFSITRKPFERKEHLTDRPFKNIRNLLKGKN